MSKNNIQVTPEALEEAYKILGIASISKSAKNDMEEDDDEEDEVEDEDSEEDKVEDKKEAKKKANKSEKVEKAEDSSILKAIETLNKNFESKIEATSTLIKGLSDELSSTKTELEKAQGTIEELQNTSAGRKSITTTNFIEKAFQENEDNGKKMLSISLHKAQIQNLLIEKAGFSGDTIEKSQIDNFWKNEMEYFEATQSIHPRAAEKLFKEDNIQLVK